MPEISAYSAPRMFIKVGETVVTIDRLISARVAQVGDAYAIQLEYQTYGGHGEGVRYHFVNFASKDEAEQAMRSFASELTC